MSRGEAKKKGQQSRPSEKSYSLFGRTSAFAGFALGDDGRVETGTEIVGKGINLIVLVDLNGFLGGVTDNMAVMAPSEVFFELSLEPRIHRTVQEIVEFLQKFFAGHG
jgi:hypothetical protein